MKLENRRLYGVILLLVITACGCSRRTVREVKQYRIEQFMNTNRMGGASFSHDEKSLLYYSNQSGVYNGYTVPVEGGPAPK